MQNLSFWIETGIQCGIAIFTIGIAWGSAQSKARLINQRISSMEKEMKSFAERYVTRQEFMDLKERINELRDDVRHILEIVSNHRGRS